VQDVNKKSIYLLGSNKSIGKCPYISFIELSCEDWQDYSVHRDAFLSRNRDNMSCLRIEFNVNRLGLVKVSLVAQRFWNMFLELINLEQMVSAQSLLFDKSE